MAKKAPAGLHIETLPLASITGADYQRMFNLRKAQAIRDGFSAEECGVLIVTDQEDGIYTCTDGQHRLWALRDLGFTEWTCQVLSTRDLPAEAQTFVDVNTKRTALVGSDRWRARRIANDPVVLEVESVVKGLGLVIGYGSSGTWRTVRATTALEKIHHAWGSERLAECLRIAGNAWPEDPDAFKADVLLGIGTFLSYYDNDAAFHRSELVDKIAAVPLRKMLQQAGAFGAGSSGGWSGSGAVFAFAPGFVKAMVQAYNHKRRTHSLEEPTLKGWKAISMARSKTIK